MSVGGVPVSRQRLVTGMAALGVAAIVAGVVLRWQVSGVDLPADIEAGPSVTWFLGMLAFVAAGWAVARHQAGRTVGWILLAMGVAWAVHGVGGVARDVIVAASTGVPAAVAHPAMPWLAWVWDVGWVPGIALVPVLLVVFPDGRPPTPAWRWVLVVAGVAALVVGISVGLRPGPFTNTPVDNPLGVPALAGAVGPLEAFGGGGWAAALLAGVAAPFVRYRQGSVLARYQLKWFLAAGIVILVAWVVADILGAAGVPTVVVANLRVLSLLALPAATAVAVFRYRLYDIDVVLSRGLVYAGLASLVGAVYVGVVFGVGALVGAGSGANVPLAVAATAIAAVAFQPAQRRLRRLANRAVYGRQASPYEVLAAFTQRMAGAYPTGEAPGSIAAAVGDAFDLAGCEVWLRAGSELHQAATWPGPPAGEARSVSIRGTDTELPGVDHIYLVRHDGDVRGAIGIRLRPGDELTSGRDGLLRDLASAAGLVLENAQLVQELRTSRQRLVATGDEQRRRIERDLHDGAQQRLLELALTLRLAHQQALRTGDTSMSETLTDGERQLRSALAELRDLARGIHPAILTERGLAAAVESIADRAMLPVTVTGHDVPRCSPPVEATAYFVVAEAMANVMKHASANRAEVHLSGHGEMLTVEVRDDGRGGADPAGSGLGGLADRVAAIDGVLQVVSPPGEGTRVRAVLPCA
jgi:signal transduction histidine kinase